MGRPKSAALEDATAINTMQATPADKTFFIETPQITRAYLHNVYDGKMVELVNGSASARLLAEEHRHV
jgi:hypothetical protein